MARAWPQTLPPRLGAEGPAPWTVAEVAAPWPAESWQRYTLQEGSKGPLVAEVACGRVVAVRDGLPGPEVWLVIRRDAVSGERKYFLSNAPGETPQVQLAWLSAARWPVERSLEDCKDELSQARLLLQAVLPRPVFDAEAALETLRQIQRANHAAYLSHRKRTLKRLGFT